MAFDRNNSVHLTALRDELSNDPESIGYASETNTNALLDLLNLDANNPTSATVNKPLEDVKVSQLAEVISSAEYTALVEYDREWVKSLIARDDETDLTPYRDKFLSVFPGGSATRSAAQALLVEDASRAEELFGYGTMLTRDDVIAARAS